MMDWVSPVILSSTFIILLPHFSLHSLLNSRMSLHFRGLQVHVMLAFKTFSLQSGVAETSGIKYKGPVDKTT